MRSRAIWLSLSVLALGCATSRPYVVEPEAASAPPAPPSAPAEPAAGSTPDLETLEAPEADAAVGVGDLAAQCQAGGAMACRSLCQAEAAVCDKDGDDYDKDDCKEISKEMADCPIGAGGMPLGRLCRLPPSRLSPTQGAAGMLAVTCKTRSLEEKQADAKWKLRRYLMARPVPVVLGPGDAAGGRRFLTDRHHLSTALFHSSVPEDDRKVYVCPMANRLDDAVDVFWPYMVNNNFSWLRNNEGESISPAELPAGLGEIGDDPYRTLSRWVRDSCGYIKCGTRCGGTGEDTSDLERCRECPVAPYFLEFHWADYLRKRLPIPGVYEMTPAEQAADLPERLGRLMSLAAEPAALDLGLPGWNGGLIAAQQVALDANGCEE